jgi:hypothetical protein
MLRAMSMEFITKNKQALSLAGVTIVGAAIFAATTGTPNRAPAPEIVEEQPARVAEPAQSQPAFSFAEMAGGEDEDSASSLWGSERPAQSPDLVNEDVPSPQSEPAIAAASAAPARLVPPAEAEVPEGRPRGDRVTLEDLRSN